MYKTIIFQIFYLLCAIKSHAQKEIQRTCCDSIEFKKINLLIDDSQKRDYLFIPYVRNTDKLCGLLVYLKLFDNLLKKGLNLNYKLSMEDIIISSSISLASDNNQNKTSEISQSQKEYLLFREFLKLKEGYEADVVYEYRKDKDNKLISDVQNAIFYSTSEYPNILYDILTSKYEALSRGRFSKEIQDFKDKNFIWDKK